MQTEETLKAVWESVIVKPVRGQRKAVKKPLNKGAITIQITLFALLMLTVYSFFSFDYKDINVFESFISSITTFKTMFLEANIKHFTVGEAIYQIIVTLGLAFLTTMLGAIVALFFGLLAAQNLSSPRVSNIVKSFVAVIRAIPTVLWVLIFAVAAGLGSAAAVIGMTFHSVAYLIKAYSESFEELDKDVIEALKGSGANWWQIVCQAVIPSAVTYLLSWTFMRFEINFTNAVAMGAAAGAGGIGFDLFMASGHYFNLHEVGFITYGILLVALALEVFTTRVKLHLKNA
ncbi:MAG: PhnE/PtxC family ABC transporter permease [Bacillota bacterium]